MEFFRVKTMQQVKDILREIPAVNEEQVLLSNALGRVLAVDITVPSDFPPFDRSAMDGYAVLSKDTFGASEGSPTLLEVTGEVLMGEMPTVEVRSGQAVKIATGGMLPKGADAVVMVEYTQIIDDRTIEVYRPVAPRENMIQRGEDIRQGEVILERGHRLRPQDLGALATLGMGSVTVYRRPVVAIISTGDEVVAIDTTPAVGQIRDTNRYTISALTLEAGGVPVHLGIARDELPDLQKKLQEGLRTSDVIAISGGSSVGARDLTIEAIGGIPDTEIVLHGVAVSPGKPTILAKAGAKIIWGLPGHPVSAMVIFMTLVVPSIMRMGGRRAWDRPFSWPLKAKVLRNVASAQGREDYVRVRLANEDGRLVATPIFGKSASISTMVKGDGLIRIDMESEGVQTGDEVEVWPF